MRTWRARPPSIDRRVLPGEDQDAAHGSSRRREAQVGREVAHRGVRRRVPSRGPRPAPRRWPAKRSQRVVARRAPRVSRNAQSLACSASSSRTARSRHARRRAASTRSSASRCAPGDVARPAGRTRCAASCGSPQLVARAEPGGHGAVSASASASSSVDERRARSARRLDERRQERRPLVPPVAEQLGVEREHARARRPRDALARSAATKSAASARACARARARGRRRAPSLAHGRWSRARAAVVVAVGGARRVAAGAPDQVDQRAVDRDEQRPGRRCAAASGAAGRRARRRSVSSTQRRVHAGLLEQRVEPRRVRALGQPEAAAPAVAEAARGGSRCRSSTCSRTPASVASSGRIAWVALLVQRGVRRAGAPSRSPPIASSRVERRARTRRPRARARRRRPRAPASRNAVDVELRARPAARRAGRPRSARARPAPRAGRRAPASATASAARPRRAGRAAAGSSVAIASHSHSSPNGQVPKPST